MAEGDPFGDLDALESQRAHDAAMARANAWINTDSAIAVHNMSRAYPWLEPDVMVASAVYGLNPDSPEMNEIAEMMAYEQRGWIDREVMSRLRSVVRFGTAGVESIYDSMPITRGIRFGVGTLVNGMSAEDAWEQSRSSELYNMQQTAMSGQDYTLGEGWFPTPQEHQDIPEYREAFLADVESQKDALRAAGRPVDQVNYDRAHLAGVRASPVDIGQSVIDDANRITYQSRRGGDPIPVSIGGLLMSQILRPGTDAYSITSGLIDFPFRVGVDPLNVPGYAIAHAMHAARAVNPAAGAAGGALEAAADALPDLSFPVTQVANTKYSSIDQVANDLDWLSENFDTLDADAKYRQSELAKLVGPDGDLSEAWNAHLAERNKPPIIPDLEQDPARQSLIEQTGFPEPPTVLTRERLAPTVGHVNPEWVAARPMQDSGGYALLVGIWNRLNETAAEYGARMAAAHTPTLDPLTELDRTQVLNVIRTGTVDGPARTVLSRFTDNATDADWEWLSTQHAELSALADEYETWRQTARKAAAEDDAHAAWAAEDAKYGTQAQARLEAQLKSLDQPPGKPAPTGMPPAETGLAPVQAIPEEAPAVLDEAVAQAATPEPSMGTRAAEIMVAAEQKLRGILRIDELEEGVEGPFTILEQRLSVIDTALEPEGPGFGLAQGADYGPLATPDDVVADLPGPRPTLEEPTGPVEGMTPDQRRQLAQARKGGPEGAEIPQLDPTLARDELEQVNVFLQETIEQVDEVYWPSEVGEDTTRIGGLRSNLQATLRKVRTRLDAMRRERLAELEDKLTRSRSKDDPVYRRESERNAEQAARQRRAVRRINEDPGAQYDRKLYEQELRSQKDITTGKPKELYTPPEEAPRGYVPEGDQGIQPEVGESALTATERVELEELRQQLRRDGSIGHPSEPTPPGLDYPRGDPYIASERQLEQFAERPIYSRTMEKMTKTLTNKAPSPAVLRQAEQTRVQIAARLRFFRQKVAEFVEARKGQPTTETWTPEIIDEEFGMVLEQGVAVEDGAILSTASALTKSERVEFRKLKTLARRVGIDEAEELTPYIEEQVPLEAYEDRPPGDLEQFHEMEPGMAAGFEEGPPVPRDAEGRPLDMGARKAEAEVRRQAMIAGEEPPTIGPRPPAAGEKLEDLVPSGKEIPERHRPWLQGAVNRFRAQGKNPTSIPKGMGGIWLEVRRSLMEGVDTGPGRVIREGDPMPVPGSGYKPEPVPDWRTTSKADMEAYWRRSRARTEGAARPAGTPEKPLTPRTPEPPTAAVPEGEAPPVPPPPFEVGRFVGVGEDGAPIFSKPSWVPEELAEEFGERVGMRLSESDDIVADLPAEEMERIAQAETVEAHRIVAEELGIKIPEQGAEAPPAAAATEPPPARPERAPTTSEATAAPEPPRTKREQAVLRRKLNTMRARHSKLTEPARGTAVPSHPGVTAKEAAEIAGRIERFTGRAKRPQSAEVLQRTFEAQASQWPNRRPFNPVELAAEFNTSPEKMRAAGQWLADMGILRWSDDGTEAVLAPMSKADGDEYLEYLTDLNNRRVDWEQLSTDPDLLEESAEWRRTQMSGQLDYEVARVVTEQVDTPIGSLDGTWENDSRVFTQRAQRAAQLRDNLPALLTEAVDVAVRRMAKQLGWRNRLTPRIIERLKKAIGYDVEDYVASVTKKVSDWADNVALDHAQVTEIRSIAEELARTAGEFDDVESIAADILAARGRGLENGPLIAGKPYEEMVLRGGVSGRRAKRAVGDLASYAEDGFVPSRRPWINPKTAESQLASRNGQRLVQWVANTTSPQQLRHILGALPREVLRRLMVASDTATVEKILLEQWGQVGGIRVRPKLGRPQRRALKRPPAPQTPLTPAEMDDLIDLLGRQRRLSREEITRLAAYQAKRTGQEIKGADIVKHAKEGSLDLPMRDVMPQMETPFARARRRWLAGGGSSGIELDVTDIDGSIAKISNLLDTIGTSATRKDSILRRMLLAEARLEGMLPIEQDIWKAIEESLRKKGYTDTEFGDIVDSWHHVRLQQVNYHIDASGQRIRLLHSGEITAFGGPEGARQIMKIPDALQEAQYSARVIVIPSVTDLRRATSNVRKMTDRLRGTRLAEMMGGDPAKLGLGRSLVTEKSNQLLSVWRAAALWRVAWPIKIVLDELARMAATSYAADMTPVGLLGWIMGKGDASVVAGTVTEQASLFGGLGTGLRLDPKTMSPTTGTFLDQTSANWQVVRGDSKAGKRAQYAELLNFHTSDLSRMVAMRGVDGAMAYLQSPAGQAVLRDVVGRATEGSATSKLFDAHTLRLHLEAIEFQHMRMASGRGIMRDVTPGRTGKPILGKWTYADRRPLPVTREEVLAEVRRGYGRKAAARLEELADEDLYAIAKADYYVVHPSVAWHPDPQGQFVILDPGQQPIRQLLASGYTGDRRPDDSLWALMWQIHNVEGEATKYRFYPKNPDNLTAMGHGRYQYDPNLVVDTLDEAVEAAGPKGHISIITEREAAALSRQVKRQGGIYGDLDADPRTLSVSGVNEFRAGTADFSGNPGAVHFDINMTPKDHEAMSDALFELYPRVDEFDDEGRYVASHSTAPAFVRAPALGKGQLLTDAPGRSKKISDATYHLLGALPTETFARHPMVRMAYWQEMAEYYLFVDEPTRAIIAERAAGANIKLEFEQFVKRATHQHGFRQLPSSRLANVDIDALNDASMARATGQVRDLLYDLTTTNNIADAARLIAPFGDAWWEVISRWGRIMNPSKNPRALLNYRRVEQAMQEVRQSGWFSEDQFGNEVFTFPVLRQLIPNVASIGASFDPRSALFVDPGNPESIAFPGSSPFMQIPAALITPLLPPELRDAIDKVVFGDFPPPQGTVDGLVNALLPTPYKRVLSLLMSEERSDELGNTISRSLMALYASGDPRYDPSTPEGQKAALEEARKAGTFIAWGRLFASIFIPGSLRFDAMQKVEQDYVAGRASAEWITVSDGAAEFFDGIRVTGSQEAAYADFIARYGTDPLWYQSATTQIKERPKTKGAYDELERHPELRAYADFTLGAFLPQIEGDDFFSRAQQDALSRDEQDIVTPDQIAARGMVRRGYMVARRMNQNFEDAQRVAIGLYGEDTDAYRAWKQEYDQRLSANNRTVQSLYFGGSTSGVIVGESNRPTYSMMLQEMREIGTPGSDRHTALHPYAPAYVDFLTLIDQMMKSAEQRVLEYNEINGTSYQTSWWRSSQYGPESVGGDVHQADAIKEWFVAGIGQAYAALPDQASKDSAMWAVNEVIAPLLNGFEEEDYWTAEILQPPGLSPINPAPATTLATASVAGP